MSIGSEHAKPAIDGQRPRLVVAIVDDRLMLTWNVVIGESGRLRLDWRTVRTRRLIIRRVLPTQSLMQRSGHIVAILHCSVRLSSREDEKFSRMSL